MILSLSPKNFFKCEKDRASHEYCGRRSKMILLKKRIAISPAEEIAILRRQLESFEALQREHKVLKEDNATLNLVLGKLVPVVESVNEIFAKHGASMVASGEDDDTLENLKDSMEALGKVKTRLSENSTGNQLVLRGARLLVNKTIEATEQVEQVFSASRELVVFNGPQSVEKFQSLGKKQVIIDGDTFLGLAKVCGEQLVEQVIRGNEAENRGLKLEAELAQSKQVNAELRLESQISRASALEFENKKLRQELETAQQGKLFKKPKVVTNSSKVIALDDFSLTPSSPEPTRKSIDDSSLDLRTPGSESSPYLKWQHYRETDEYMARQLEKIRDQQDQQMLDNPLPIRRVNQPKKGSSSEVRLSPRHIEDMSGVYDKSPLVENKYPANLVYTFPVGKPNGSTDLGEQEVINGSVQEKMPHIAHATQSFRNTLASSNAGRGAGRVSSRVKQSEKKLPPATVKFGPHTVENIDLSKSKNIPQLRVLASELMKEKGLTVEFQQIPYKTKLVDDLAALFRAHSKFNS